MTTWAWGMPEYIQHYKQGNLYFNEGNYDKAAKKYQLSIKLKNNFTPSHFNLARCYYYLKDLNKSAKHLKKTISIDSTYKGAHFRLGLIYDKQGKINLALKEYLTSFKYDKETLDYANLRVGVLYMNKTLYQKAKWHLEKAYSLNSQEGVFPFQLAVCYFRLGLLDKAIVYYKAATSYKEKIPEVYYDLGFAYRELYEYKLAKKYFKEYISQVRNDFKKKPFRDAVNTAIKQIKENKLPKGKLLTFTKPIKNDRKISFSYPDEFKPYKKKKISEVESIKFTSSLTSENININFIPNPDKTYIKTLYSRYLNIILVKNIWQKDRLKIVGINSTQIRGQKSLIFDIVYKHEKKGGHIYYTYLTSYILPLSYPKYNCLVECQIPSRIKRKGFVEKILMSMKVIDK